MKKLLARLISYILYYLGDLVSKPLNKYDEFAWLYPLYNYLMLLSYYVQHWGGLDGPWTSSTATEEDNATN